MSFRDDDAAEPFGLHLDDFGAILDDAGIDIDSEYDGEPGSHAGIDFDGGPGRGAAMEDDPEGVLHLRAASLGEELDYVGDEDDDEDEDDDDLLHLRESDVLDFGEDDEE